MDNIDQVIDTYLIANCCFLIGPTAKPELFGALFAMEGFNICRGCGDNGQEVCTPISANVFKAIKPTLGYAKTNAEYAEELGVTKRQVAKMRKRGELKE